jgi:DNA invertase Pin-like site-specific DNA recombinase
MKVVRVYTDDDRSAYSGKPRPAFEQMIGELDLYDVVIYWKTDRLVRRLTQFNRVLEACEQADVRLVSVVDPIDTSTPILKGVASLMASLGEQESHNTSTRVRRLQEELAARGMPSGHRRAFGYELDGMTVRKDEAKLIREARDRIFRGESMSSICTDWTARGVQPATPGASWRVTTFKKIMCGTRIAGLRKYRGETVGKAAWPSIISTADRDRLIAVLGDPKSRSRGRPGSYLLSKLLVCGRCGGRLHAAVHGDGGRIWRCTKTPGDNDRCGRCQIRAEPVDELVEEALLYRLDSPALARAMRRGARGSKTSASTVTDLEQKLTQLGLDHDAGLVTRKEWLARRGPLSDRLDKARAELAAETDTTALSVLNGVDVRQRWSKLDLPARRAVAATMIDRVTIAPGAPGTTFDPDRVDISWSV